MNTPSPTNEKPRPPEKDLLKDVVTLIKGIRWSYAFIALCLAVTLWYTVTVRDKVESWMDVQVAFKGAPENLVISDGLINKMSVRVRAARGLSRSITGREATVVVDLSSISRGSNAIAVKRDMLPFSSAYEVMEIVPSRILILADTRASKEMTLQSRFVGKLAPDLFIKTIRISPEKVIVNGAESLVTGLSQIRIPVPLAPDTPKGNSTVTVAVPVPANIAVAPPQVSVELEVGVRTKQLKLTRTVVPTGYKDGRKVSLSADKVVIVADVPESTSRDEKKVAAIAASVALPPDLGEDPRTLPIDVSLPENATLVSVTPAEVSVSNPKLP